MSVSVEKLENSMARLTIEVSAADVDKEINKVYNRQKSRLNVPGFRKGHAPRKILEKLYGEGIFLEDAVNGLINSTYPEAAEESGEFIVSEPEIDIVQVKAGEPLIYTAVVAVKPPVSLGKYKGIEVARKELVVTDEDVENELKKEQDKNASFVTVTDRPVKDGDKIKLDFEGFVDGVPFEGGKGEDYDLTIGSGAFIPGFEEKLVGAPVGEEVEVDVTFPEVYQAEELAGKPAVFKCTVKSIQEKILPEIDDEFADEVSEFSTLAEMKEDIRARLLGERQKARRTEIETEVIDQIIADAEIKIPEPMLLTQQKRLLDDFKNQMMQYGIQYDQYLQMTGNTEEKMLENFKEQAEKRIRSSLCLDQIAVEENIQATEEDFEAELAEMASNYGMEVDAIRKYYNDRVKEDMMKDIAARKAMEFVADHAVEVDRPAEADKTAD